MQLKGSSPTLIVGMHRSGTSLLAELLQAQGLFVGWRLDSHHESTFFQRLNRRFTAEAGGHWSQPEIVAAALERSDPAVLAEPLRPYLNGPLAVEYWGRRYRTRHNDSRPWGWKDPRNGYLLSLWRAIFPDLQVIWIRRDPRETAESMLRRAQQVRAMIETNAASAATSSTLRRANVVYRGHPMLADAWKALHPDGCLEIALAYERIHQRALQADQPGVLIVDYPQLIASPHVVLGQCVDFVGLASGTGTRRDTETELGVDIRKPSLDRSASTWHAIEDAAVKYRSELNALGYP